MSELKPCPFCSSKNIVINDYHSMTVFIQCNDCGVTFPHFESEQEAIEAWNRRVDKDVLLNQGIVRRVDDLGRIAIPKDYRRQLSIREGQELKIVVINDFIVIGRQ